MSASRVKQFEKAQMRVLFQVPFFAPGVAKLEVEFLPEAKYRAATGMPEGQAATACTNGQRIIWCEEHFDKLSDGERVTVLCHEVSHCLLGHMWRAPGGADWDIWNQATDHAVNLMLKGFSELVTCKNLADPFPFPEPKEAYCADPQFKDLAEEIIYQRLATRPKHPGGGGKVGNGAPKQGQGNPAPGSMPAFGQIMRPAGAQADPAAQQKMKTEWSATLMQSAQMCKGRGDLPAGIARLVDDIVNPKVPWRDILRSWLREQASDDYDFLTPALEWSESEFILPSLRSDKVGTVVFATDTSGSIDQVLLAQFQAEKQNCLDDLRPARLVDIYCDSAIHKVAEYSRGDTIDTDAPGGGGTSFRPVFKHVASMSPPPKALVYLTDLDGDFPDADPGYPVIWVTWTEAGKAPFGEVVYAR